MGRPTIKLVDVTRSTESKTWETEMYTHIYEQRKAEGKMDGWIPKDKIDAIKTETFESASPEDEVVIEQLNDSDAEETAEESIENTTDLELMNVAEMRVYAKDNGVEIHHAMKNETKIRKKIKAALV